MIQFFWMEDTLRIEPADIFHYFQVQISLIFNLEHMVTWIVKQSILAQEP